MHKQTDPSANAGKIYKDSFLYKKDLSHKKDLSLVFYNVKLSVLYCSFLAS